MCVCVGLRESMKEHRGLQKLVNQFELFFLFFTLFYHALNLLRFARENDVTLFYFLLLFFPVFNVYNKRTCNFDTLNLSGLSEG